MIPPLFAIFAFPVLVAVLFARMRPERAMIASILLGYLFLPHGRGLDLPMIPPINKDFVPAVAALVAMLMVLGRPGTPDPRFLPTWLPRDPRAAVFLAMIFIGVVGTVLTNGDRLVYGAMTISGLSTYDIASVTIQTLVMLVPFLLARRFLCHPDQQVSLLWLLVAAGLAYSFLSLFETRFSPQLNTKIYGYFQHDWRQHLRGGGYRPIVFLQHGLWVSVFFSAVVLAAITLFRIKTFSGRPMYLLVAGWVLMVLMLTKSLGAFLITLALAPVILFCTSRMQLKVAAILAIIVISYPALRGGGLVPINQVSSFAASIDPGRALSLEYRLQNEELLLEHAQQRPLFGWGTWGRHFVYDEQGNTISVTDGYWIIVISAYGWVGYIGIFGLLSTGVIGLFLKRKQLDISPATAGLSVILAGNLVDLIPNATVTPVTWMIAGALLGRFELGQVSQEAETAAAPEAPRALPYSRFGVRKGPRARADELPAHHAALPAAREDSRARTLSRFSRDGARPPRSASKGKR
jgi:hypothetical protein